MKNVVLLFILGLQEVRSNAPRLMNFSWAMDLDPKGANNQIKEAIDKRYLPDDEPIAKKNRSVSIIHMT